MNSTKRQFETGDCESVTEVFDEFLCDSIPPALRESMVSHLDNCRGCNSRLLEHAEYLRIMTNLSVHNPEPGHLAHQIRKARLHGEQLAEELDTSRSSLASFYTGFASASVMLIALLGFFQLDKSSVPEASVAAFSTIEYAPIEQEVTIVIDVPEDMLAARLSLDFPDALRLQGLEDLQRIAWAVDLKQGANVLTLPLRVVSKQNLNSSLKIAASVEYHNNIRDFLLTVDLSPPQNQRHDA